MVFPVESEDRTMRNLLMLCQDNARLIVEAFRKILLMIDDLAKKDPEFQKDNLNEIQRLADGALGIKRNLMKEIHETGGILVNREDFYRLVTSFGDLMDQIYGIGVRLSEIGERKWTVPEKSIEGLVKMSDIAFQILTKLRESIMSLGFNSQRAVNMAREIDEAERELDTVYRSVDIEIISSNSELYTILILRDIAKLIEDTVDTARGSADLIRILAL